MKIRVLGGGIYGSHLALALIRDRHKVELHEIAAHLFAGASGNQPARTHRGFHYPRSKLTRAACQDHYKKLMATYGHLTRAVPTNIYAVAANLSLVDFANYTQSLRDEVEFITIDQPEEFGLRNVEGAVLTGERHLVIREARNYFTDMLRGAVRYETPASKFSEDDYDLTVDCTFCAQEANGVDRYEPCITGILRGPTNFSLTIMDGPFPSIFAWDPAEGTCSLTSARLTPISKECRSYAEARAILDDEPPENHRARCDGMLADMAHFYPAVRDRYELIGWMKAIRAMPLSGADARLVDVVRISPKTIRIRASKLDAIFYAEQEVKEAIKCLSSS